MVAAPVQVLQVGATDWQLAAPLSRAVALADGRQIVLAGGLTAAQTTATGVFTLDPATGRLTSDGSLVEPVHDAAGAVLDGRLLVFGGGAAHSVAAVQQLVPAAVATLIGTLPQPRSDLVTATIGGTTYVLGGYTGTDAVSTVLATRDGRAFTTVARLPVSVRYPAVATVGGIIYLFGGEHDGVPTPAIQRIDPGTGIARVTGHLPTPLAHAAAFVLGGSIYLAGGRTGTAIDDAIWRFDPGGGQTAAAGTLPSPVADAASVTVAGVGYLIGGENPKPVATAVTLRLVAQSPASRP